jgi:hypothetical protein
MTMKIAIIVLVNMWCAGSAFAQWGGSISWYSDNPGFSNCYLAEAIGVVSSIYVVHDGTPEATASRFRVAHNWHQVTVLSTDYHTNVASGNIYTGVTVTYPNCETLPYLLATLLVLPTSPAPDCSVFFYVVPDPAAASGHIEVVDCSGTNLFANGGALAVNGNDVDCNCHLLNQYPPPPWVAAEPATWGAVKALYR